jgi:hypothetical protein
MAKRKNNLSTANATGATVGYEAQLWQMADALRGSMDAAEYKHVVLGLIFLKYISDAFEEHHARLETERAQGADPEDPDEYRAENIFWVPPEARWAHLKAQAKQPTIGQLVDDAMAAIERDNPAVKGRSGWLHLQRLMIDSFEREEYLLFSGFDDEGRSLDQETMEKLFHCEGKAEPLSSLPTNIEARLAAEADRRAKATINRSLETNNRHLQEAREKLEKWADDMVLAAEKELKDTKERIKVLTRQARLATTIEEQHVLQKQIQELEKQKRRQRQRIFDVEDEIMARRDELIARLEKRFHRRTSVQPLFTIRWSVV